VGFLNSLGAIERSVELIMLASIRGFITSPHLKGNLKGLFQPFVPFCDRREWNTQPAMFLLVPGRANAKVGASV
jgi:hypothetical protein